MLSVADLGSYGGGAFYWQPSTLAKSRCKEDQVLRILVSCTTLSLQNSTVLNQIVSVIVPLDSHDLPLSFQPIQFAAGSFISPLDTTHFHV